MLRILHTIDTTGPGGAETVFINLVKGLDPDRYHSVVAIRGPGWVYDKLRTHNIEPLFIPSKGSFNLRYLLSLIRLIRREKIDFVQSHLLGSNLYCSLAGLICRVPVVSTFHGFVDATDGERLIGLKSWLINRGSRKIVFVSNRLREHYVEKLGFSSDKAVTIFNGVDTSVFFPNKGDSIRNELGLTPGNILIGAVGNIRPAKGYDVFLKAARLVHDRHPEARFLIAGQGSGGLYEDLLRLRKELGLEDVFHLIGFREDAAKILNNLDIFVLASSTEGFSISTIEAMACEVPVIVTRSGGPEEIVADRKNGILVECDSQSIAYALEEFFFNPILKQEFINNARKELDSKFSLEAMKESYQNIYDHSMGN